MNTWYFIHHAIQTSSSGENRLCDGLSQAAGECSMHGGAGTDCVRNQVPLGPDGVHDDPVEVVPEISPDAHEGDERHVLGVFESEIIQHLRELHTYKLMSLVGETDGGIHAPRGTCPGCPC